MYAIVATGGKQYRVAQDDVFAVERIDAEVGSTVELPVLLLSDGDKITVDAAVLSSAKVTAEIVEQTRGAKVIVFKFKKRKGYKRTKGHRQELTMLKVTGIPGAAAAPAKKTTKKAAKAEVAEEVVVVEAAEAVEAPVEEKPKRTRAKKAEAAVETETAEAPEAETAESAE
jgi:large subunit ribosomal protein L21